MLLVFFLEPAKDRHRVLDTRLFHHHRLEPPGQRCILFHMLAVLVERGCADTVQLATRQSRLEQVGRIHRAIGLARANQRVHLVDEQDDPAIVGLDFRKQCLEALFKLTAVFRPGNQCAHIKRHQLLVLERFRHIAINDSERQAFRDRGLADARFTDQHRIVLGPA